MPQTAILVAAASATGFAVSSSLQHMAAVRTRGHRHATHRLLAHLARRPWWLLGQLIAVAAFALHAAALHLGTVVVVQPIVVSGIVLAVPVRAGLARRLPSRGEVTTVALTAAGLGLFLMSARPVPGHLPLSPGPGLMVTVAAALSAAVVTWFAGRFRRDERAAFWFGVASGMLFGVVAGLVKLTTTLAAADSHPLSFLTYWSTWAVLVLGLSGVAINQRAYRAARMSASLPVLNILDVLVALLFGIVVFGEVPTHTPLAVAGELVALVCIGIGLRRLGRDELFADEAADASPVGSPAATR